MEQNGGSNADRLFHEIRISLVQNGNFSIIYFKFYLWYRRKTLAANPKKISTYPTKSWCKSKKSPYTHTHTHTQAILIVMYYCHYIHYEYIITNMLYYNKYGENRKTVT